MHAPGKPVLDDAVSRFDRMGLTARFHTAGDAAVRAGLHAIEAARKGNGFSTLSHDVGHLREGLATTTCTKTICGAPEDTCGSFPLITAPSREFPGGATPECQPREAACLCCQGIARLTGSERPGRFWQFCS